MSLNPRKGLFLKSTFASRQHPYEQPVFARVDASRQGSIMMNSFRDQNEGMHRSRKRGDVPAVTPDLCYERKGAGAIGRM